MLSQSVVTEALFQAALEPRFLVATWSGAGAIGLKIASIKFGMPIVLSVASMMLLLAMLQIATCSFASDCLIPQALTHTLPMVTIAWGLKYTTGAAGVGLYLAYEFATTTQYFKLLPGPEPIWHPNGSRRDVFAHRNNWSRVRRFWGPRSNPPEEVERIEHYQAEACDPCKSKARLNAYLKNRTTLADHAPGNRSNGSGHPGFNNTNVTCNCSNNVFSNTTCNTTDSDNVSSNCSANATSFCNCSGNAISNSTLRFSDGAFVLDDWLDATTWLLRCTLMNTGIEGSSDGDFRVNISDLLNDIKNATNADAANISQDEFADWCALPPVKNTTNSSDGGGGGGGDGGGGGGGSGPGFYGFVLGPIRSLLGGIWSAISHLLAWIVGFLGQAWAVYLDVATRLLFILLALLALWNPIYAFCNGIRLVFVNIIELSVHAGWGYYMQAKMFTGFGAGKGGKDAADSATVADVTGLVTKMEASFWVKVLFIALCFICETIGCVVRVLGTSCVLLFSAIWAVGNKYDLQLKDNAARPSSEQKTFWDVVESVSALILVFKESNIAFSEHLRDVSEKVQDHLSGETGPRAFWVRLPGQTKWYHLFVCPDAKDLKPATIRYESSKCTAEALVFPASFRASGSPRAYSQANRLNLSSVWLACVDFRFEEEGNPVSSGFVPSNTEEKRQYQAHIDKSVAKIGGARVLLVQMDRKEDASGKAPAATPAAGTTKQAPAPQPSKKHQQNYKTATPDAAPPAAPAAVTSADPVLALAQQFKEMQKKLEALEATRSQ